MDNLSDLLHSVRRFVEHSVRPHVSELDAGPGCQPSLDLRTVLDTFGVLRAAPEGELDLRQMARVLSCIAEECGGVAAFAAWAVAGDALARRSGVSAEGRLAALALWEPADVAIESGRPGWSTTMADQRVSGRKRMVIHAPHAELFAVVCGRGPETHLAWIERGNRVNVGQPIGTLGLRAVPIADIVFDEAPVLTSTRLDLGDLVQMLALPALLSTACACGSAIAAVEMARAYAHERYQGGRRIADHDAVSLMLSRNGAAVDAACTVVFAAADAYSEGDALAHLRCLQARQAALGSTVRATFDAVQVLGGYGYMRDFGMEKRLRDVVTLSQLPIDETRLSLLVGRWQGAA